MKGTGAASKAVRSFHNSGAQTDFVDFFLLTVIPFHGQYYKNRAPLQFFGPVTAGNLPARD
jgi:hypothetical protein